MVTGAPFFPYVWYKVCARQGRDGRERRVDGGRHTQNAHGREREKTGMVQVVAEGEAGSSPQGRAGAPCVAPRKEGRRKPCAGPPLPPSPKCV